MAGSPCPSPAAQSCVMRRRLGSARCRRWWRSWRPVAGGGHSRRSRHSRHSAAQRSTGQSCGRRPGHSALQRAGGPAPRVGGTSKQQQHGSSSAGPPPQPLQALFGPAPRSSSPPQTPGTRGRTGPPRGSARRSCGSAGRVNHNTQVLARVGAALPCEPCRRSTAASPHPRVLLPRASSACRAAVCSGSSGPASHPLPIAGLPGGARQRSAGRSPWGSHPAAGRAPSPPPHTPRGLQKGSFDAHKLNRKGAGS